MSRCVSNGHHCRMGRRRTIITSRKGHVIKLSDRPPPTVLFVHNGTPFHTHMQLLVDSRLRVTETHADTAIGEATTAQPDLIVLDLDCNGETVERLKAEPMTQHIPII